MRLGIALSVLCLGLAGFAALLVYVDRKEAERAAEVAWLKARIEQYRQIIDETCNVIGE